MAKESSPFDIRSDIGKIYLGISHRGTPVICYTFTNFFSFRCSNEQIPRPHLYWLDLFGFAWASRLVAFMRVRKREGSERPLGGNLETVGDGHYRDGQAWRLGQKDGQNGDF
jgi:hypothetical protein